MVKYTVWEDTFFFSFSFKEKDYTLCEEKKGITLQIKSCKFRRTLQKLGPNTSLYPVPRMTIARKHDCPL